MHNTGTIKIRYQTYANARHIDVFIDGNKKGNIAWGQEAAFEIDSGHHTVQAKAGPYSSSAIDVNISSNASLILDCKGSPKYWGRLLLLMVIFVTYIFVADFHMFVGEQHIALVSSILIILLVLFLVWIMTISSKPDEVLLLKIPQNFDHLLDL